MPTSDKPIACVNQYQLAELRAISKARGKDLVGDLTRTFFCGNPRAYRRDKHCRGGPRCRRVGGRCA